MVSTIPCSNPAHGVKNHIAGTAAAIECARIGSKRATSSIAAIGFPTSATTRSEANVPERRVAKNGMVEYAEHDESETERDWYAKELDALNIPHESFGEHDMKLGFSPGSAPNQVVGVWIAPFDKKGDQRYEPQLTREWKSDFEYASRNFDFDEYRDKMAQARADGWEPGRAFSPAPSLNSYDWMTAQCYLETRLKHEGIDGADDGGGSGGFDIQMRPGVYATTGYTRNSRATFKDSATGEPIEGPEFDDHTSFGIDEDEADAEIVASAIITWAKNWKAKYGG